MDRYERKVRHLPDKGQDIAMKKKSARKMAKIDFTNISVIFCFEEHQKSVFL